jgi:hypothetical protein
MLPVECAVAVPEEMQGSLPTSAGSQGQTLQPLAYPGSHLVAAYLTSVE